MLNEFKTRWKAEVPKFFAKLKAIAVTVFASATAVWTANDFYGLELDEITLTVCKYAIAISVSTGLTSQLTMKNPPKQ